MYSTRFVDCYLLLVCGFMVSFLAAADNKTVETVPFALDTTAAERSRKHVLNQPVKEPSLAFPYLHYKKIYPKPFAVPKGMVPDRRYPDQCAGIWRVIPLTPKVNEYLEKRTAVKGAAGRAALAAWCLQNKLDACAEYEWMCRLTDFQNWQQPGYRPVINAWLKLARLRSIEWSFPLPVKGEWHVIVDRTKHHQWKAGAAFAFDLVVHKNNRSFSGTGRRLEDHYAWGQPVIAQADGVVIQAGDASPDMPIGKSGGFANANFITVNYGGGVLGAYGHLQKGSAKVKRGDRVVAGQELARVGNSGASGAPHLHFTMMNNGNLSVKGRYTFERKTGNRWIRVDGKDLPEGVIVRNVPNIFDPRKRLVESK